MNRPNPSINALLGFIENKLVADGTPVNAVNGTYTITELEFALLNNDDTITVDGNTFKKVASATEADEFEDLAGLVALIDALDNYDAEVDESTAVITYSTAGVIGNGKEITTEIVSATTDNFNTGVTASNATVPVEDISELDTGDIVEFDGNTWTKVASEAGTDEFSDQTELIALIDALDDWGAVDSLDDIVITYSDDTTDKDGLTVDMTFYRETASGVNGTEGEKSDSYLDASYVYFAVADNTIAGKNWRRITLGTY